MTDLEQLMIQVTVVLMLQRFIKNIKTTSAVIVDQMTTLVLRGVRSAQHGERNATTATYSTILVKCA